jgi:hypothetical protein
MKSILIAAALFVTAAAPAFAQDAPAAATADVNAATGLSAPPAGKGQVVFFRRSSLLGFPYWTNVRENGVAYGKLTNGVYFVQVLDPGVHQFDTSVLGKDAMKVNVDPGETYYVEGKITMQLVGYTITMAPSDEGAFARVKNSLKLAPAPEAK